MNKIRKRKIKYYYKKASEIQQKTFLSSTEDDIVGIKIRGRTYFSLGNGYQETKCAEITKDKIECDTAEGIFIIINRNEIGWIREAVPNFKIADRNKPIFIDQPKKGVFELKKILKPNQIVLIIDKNTPHELIKEKHISMETTTADKVIEITNILGAIPVLGEVFADPASGILSIMKTPPDYLGGVLSFASWVAIGGGVVFNALKASKKTTKEVISEIADILIKIKADPKEFAKHLKYRAGVVKRLIKSGSEDKVLAEMLYKYEIKSEDLVKRAEGFESYVKDFADQITYEYSRKKKTYLDSSGTERIRNYISQKPVLLDSANISEVHKRYIKSASKNAMRKFILRLKSNDFEKSMAKAIEGEHEQVFGLKPKLDLSLNTSTGRVQPKSIAEARGHFEKSNHPNGTAYVYLNRYGSKNIEEAFDQWIRRKKGDLKEELEYYKKFEIKWEEIIGKIERKIKESKLSISSNKANFDDPNKDMAHYDSNINTIELNWPLYKKYLKSGHENPKELELHIFHELNHYIDNLKIGKRNDWMSDIYDKQGKFDDIKTLISRGPDSEYLNDPSEIYVRIIALREYMIDNKFANKEDAIKSLFARYEKDLRKIPNDLRSWTNSFRDENKDDVVKILSKLLDEIH